MDFKTANTEKEVEKILQEGKKNGSITKVDYLKADLRKIEIRLRKRKNEGEKEEEEGVKRRRLAVDPGECNAIC